MIDKRPFRLIPHVSVRNSLLKLAVMLVPVPLVASGGAPPDGFAASLDGKQAQLVIDGVTGDEWLAHELRAFVPEAVEPGTSSNWNLSWRSTWDNHLWYFLVEGHRQTDPDTAGEPEALPQAVYLLIDVGAEDWRLEWNPQAPKEIALLESASGSPRPETFVAAQVTDESFVLEVAISMEDLNRPIFIGDDFVEEKPQIAVDLRCLTHDSRILAWHSAEPPDASASNWGRVTFGGSPAMQRVIVTHPDDGLINAEGGTPSFSYKSFYPDLDPAVSVSASWMTARWADGELEVEVEPNDGANRSGAVRFGRYGEFLLHQWGTSGNPWFFEDRGALRHSRWMGPLFDQHFPWTHSHDLGWVYVFGNKADNLYFYDSISGDWFWSSDQYYPNLYWTGTDEGWRYLLLSHDPSIRWFWDYDSETWFRAQTD